MKKEVSIWVSGMHCNSCAKLISESLLELKGVEKARVSFPDEKVEIVFDSEKVTLEKIEGELNKLGYGLAGSPPFPHNAEKPCMAEETLPTKAKEKSGMAEETLPTKAKEKSGIKQGVLFGLIPHIGCIGFIAASIIGATFAVELFKPLLLNPWFFYILILISLGFATATSAFYLHKNGILSFAGIARKKKYLSTMYGSTLAVNLLFFFVIFPLAANFDTGTFAANAAGSAALPVATVQNQSISQLRLQVDIPCSGHAPLISGELKKLSGVTRVAFQQPNFFDVSFDSAKTTKQELLSIDVFKTYKATVVNESASAASGSSVASGSQTQQLSSANNAEQPISAAACGGQGGSCCGTGGCGCGAK